MKIKIIRNGGYLFGGSLKLPVTVEAIQVRKYQYGVEGSDLIKLGASPKYINNGQLYLFNASEVGSVHCKAIRQGDQMQCACGLAWDVDEEYTPQCQN